MQSILRWAGSKRLLLPELTKHVPNKINRYVEPFAGSAALFFKRQPPVALLTDLNKELITTYRTLRNDPGLVLECFRRLPVGSAEYYKVRSINTDDLPDSEIAARFLYLNRYCFNGLYRTNANGHFNVPYGPPRQSLGDFEQRILSASRLLSRAEIRAQDFEATVVDAKEGDFYYLDPPYAIDDRRVFREYIPGTFSRRDLHRLRNALKELDRRGVIFLLSYANGPEANALAYGWQKRIVVTRRHVAGFAHNRRIVEEMLVSNQSFKEH